jgi:hypothetical protein
MPANASRPWSAHRLTCVPCDSLAISSSMVPWFCDTRSFAVVSVRPRYGQDTPTPLAHLAVMGCTSALSLVRKRFR